MVKGECVFRQVNLAGQEFVQFAHVAVFPAYLGDIAVDVVDFRWAAFGQILVHGRVVQRMCHAGGVQNGCDFRLTGAEQLVSGCLGRAVGFVHQLFGEPSRVGMRVELSESDLVHGAQRVEHGVEHDLRHAHADEVVHDGGVQRGGFEILEQFLFRCGHGVGHGVGVGAQVHGLGVRATGEVEVARPVHVGADQRGAAVDAVFGEVCVELFEMPVAVHGGEYDLLVVEQVGATLEHAVELHLLDEYDPHIRLAGVFLRIVHVDRHQVAVFAVLGHVGAALFADLLDVRLPGVDEVDVLVREFLQQHAVLDAHAASANHRILHVPCLLSPVVFVVFKRIPTRYREISLSMPAWLYALLMEGANRNNSFL